MRKHITSFYMETLLLILVFVAIILILTQVFGAARVSGTAAADLTRAVRLAENAAEAVSASDSPDALAALLMPAGGAEVTSGTVSARYDADLNPAAGGAYQVSVTWAPADGLVESRIAVTKDGRSLYELETAVYPAAFEED